MTYATGPDSMPIEGETGMKWQEVCEQVSTESGHCAQPTVPASVAWQAQVPALYKAAAEPSILEVVSVVGTSV